MDAVIPACFGSVFVKLNQVADNTTTNAFTNSLTVYSRGSAVGGATQLSNLYVNMPLNGALI